jgi:sialate O-acetylesterase
MGSNVLKTARVIAALLLASTVDRPHANVSVTNVFLSHAVFQRNMPIPVWGKASPGEQVSVTLGSQTKTTATPSNGSWLVTLDPMSGAGPLTLTIKGNNTITAADVYIGEVWQVAGQSNMDTRLSFYANLADSIKKADVPLMRYYTLRQPGQTTGGLNPWLVVSPSTAGDCSATGYFFGKEVLKTTGVAVGLVVTAVGGTRITQWMDPATLSANPAITDSDKGTMWNTWVAPVVGYGMKGTVWIQGENNANSADAPSYGDRFKTLIRGWRAAWGQGDFPFYYLSLSNTHALQTDPNNASNVAPIREGQRLALVLPNTAMGVSIDIGDAGDWHYANKPEAGRRLSLLARALTYGESSLVYSGPMYRSKTISGNRIKLLFETYGSGLAAKGGAALKGFAIAGATGNWVWGDATISGDTVIVSSASVPAPTRVRYAWADNPVFNLFNKEGLPASPFTTESPQVMVVEKGPLALSFSRESRNGDIREYWVNALGRICGANSTSGTQVVWQYNGGRQRGWVSLNGIHAIRQRDQP